MPRTRAQLERENVQLWEKLEAVYDGLHELFEGEAEAETPEEEDAAGDEDD